tara:strand:+ start:2977 stop:3687 length:711 start_codon:yes stop_codon:yes gene_type:complete
VKKDIKKFTVLILLFLFTNLFTANIFRIVKAKNITLIGSDLISIDDITENTSLKLPTRLIFIKTKLIEKELKQNLSLKQISIIRQIFPFGLIIQIKHRVPLAFTEKKVNDTIVEGYVDIEGIFIEKRYLPYVERLRNPIKIFGWDHEYKNFISEILKSYRKNDDLTAINISSEGFITLDDKKLEKIFLGSRPPEINQQLIFINEIKNQLSNIRLQKKIKSLDLSDPFNPQIKVFIP